MIDHLVRERGLTREDAYILCSLAGDLKITEVVDVPTGWWAVRAGRGVRLVIPRPTWFDPGLDCSCHELARVVQ